MVTAVDIPANELERLMWYVYQVKRGKDTFRDSRAIVYPNKQGFDAFSAYYIEKTHKQPVKTKHPRLLKAILDQEYAAQELVEQYSADLHRQMMSTSEFEGLCRQLGLPKWLRDEVYRHKRECWGL